jgi:hypothetical protein
VSSDDFRMTVRLPGDDAAAELVRRLHELRLDEDERALLGERVIVSRDDDTVFLYADSAERLHAAEPVVRRELGDGAEVTLERWHPVAQEWQAVDAPMPETEAEIDAEEDRVREREEAEAAETGYADWEVRVELPTPEETDTFGEKLEAEGIPVIRRHRFVLVGAASEEDARELAERLRAEAPAGAKVEVEPSGEMVWEVMPRNPFAVFGGLGL